MPYADPEKQRKAKRESARRTRAGVQGSGSRAREGVEPLPIDATTPAGVSAVLQESIDQVRASGADALMRGRVLAQLAAQVLKAHEAGELVERFDALEARLNEREQA